MNERPEGGGIHVQDRIFRTLQRYITPAPGCRLGFGVSGGADSVALLRLLHEPIRRAGVECVVVHVNHALRGEDSEADEAFVRSLASELGLAAHVTCAPLPPGERGLERRARQLRLDAFAAAAREHALDAVLTAHTLDDQAETVLFRLLRGTGLPGLASIAPVLSLPGVRLIRPLLDIRRADLRGWLAANGYSWREDHSNRDLRFDRNRIRHGLLAELERDWNPALTEVLARLARQAREDEEAWTLFLESYLDKVYKDSVYSIVIPVAAMTSLPDAALARLIRLALREVPGAAPDDPALRAAVALIRKPAGEGMLAGPGFFGVRSGKWLRFSKSPLVEGAGFRLSVPGPGEWPGPDRRLALEVIDAKDFPGAHESARVNLYNGGSSFLDGRWLAFPLTLRSWEPGDRYQPWGLSSEQKLKELFQRFQVPSWERASWPILVSDGRIVWARRFGVAGWAAARKDSREIWRIREADGAPGAGAPPPGKR